MAKAAAPTGPEYTTDPTSLKRGMPQAQHNGLYGSEDRLMQLGVKGRTTAIVTFEVADIKSSEAEHSRFPLVEMVHIEPITGVSDLETLQGIQEEAYKSRTGADQLNFDGLSNGSGDDENEEAAE